MDRVAARVLRGRVVESVHRASIAVVDPQGRLVASFGDPNLSTFARSSIKPIQAIPLIESGAADRFGFAPEDLAAACSSHNGEPRHAERVESILRRIGLGTEALQCGAHAPYHAGSAQRVGDRFSALHNNCSGKHAGMLATCVHKGWDPATYLDPKHPLQRRIRALVAEEAGVPPRLILAATDGCSAPNFALPLRGMARAFARLMAGDAIPGPRGAALARLRDAMMSHPFLVGGTDRADTRLMEALPGKVWAKAGGEACYGLGVREPALGAAIKVEDGSPRAVPWILARVLDELGVLGAKGRKAVAPLLAEPIKNVRGTAVGRIEADFRLRRRPSGRSP